VLCPKSRAIAGGKALRIDSIWQVSHAIMAELRFALLRLFLAHADDEISILQNAARAEQCAERTAPFELALNRLQQRVQLVLRHIKDTAVHGDDEGLAAQSCGRPHFTTQTLQCVRVEEAHIRCSQQRGEQRDRKQIAALLVHGQTICRAQAKERIAIAVPLHGHLADDFVGSGAQSLAGDDARIKASAPLLPCVFEHDGLGATPVISDEAARDVEDGRALGVGCRSAKCGVLSAQRGCGLWRRQPELRTEH